jgi:SPP1 gp7 family putative phage head morphogenesis protein
MKAASKKTVQKLASQGLALEYGNAEVLRKNLAKARNQLYKNQDKHGFNPLDYGSAIDEALGQFKRSAAEQIVISNAIQLGENQGVILAAEMITGGRSDQGHKVTNLLLWKPILPLAAISLKESEFAELITNMAADLKIEQLRMVQQGLAQGFSTRQLSDQLLGAGLRGAMGRDGIWRKATTRAETIARTVSNDAINYGAQLTYAQMDQITPEAGFEKVWQTVSDNRTSDICQSLLGQRRKIDELFEGNGWSGQRPPSHPNCRSRITLVARRYEANWDLRYAT